MKIRKERINEATIQGELYHFCKSNNIPCILEYRDSYSNGDKKRKKCRFDAVIYSELTNDVILIIECKSYKNPEWKPKPGNKQIYKYSQFNTPIFLLTNPNNLQEDLNSIKNIYLSYIESEPKPEKVKSILDILLESND